MMQRESAELMNSDKLLIKVIWIDAQDHGEAWVHESDVDAFGAADCPIVSVGFLVRKTAKYLTLAGDYDIEDGNYGRVTKIPSAWVQSIEYLNTAPSPDSTEPQNS